MSYILDALKKSEQERGNGRVPDVQTIHSSSLSYRNDKKAYWPYVLIAAVMLNLLAISYFIIRKDGTAETQVKQEVGTIAVQTADADSSAEDEPTVTAAAQIAVEESEKLKFSQPLPEARMPAENSTASAPVSEAEEKPAVTEVQPADRIITHMPRTEPPASSDSQVIDFHDLPDSIKQQLPAIIVSAHVYSSNPAQRSVVINNNFMEEGEYLLDGLILQRITPDGAIFNYQGTLFNYGVVSGWQ